MVIETGRDLLNFGKHENILSSIRRLATPFLGFVLSDFYLSDELVNHQLQWLNKDSRVLIASEVKLGNVVYCQVDQIEDFADNYLPAIQWPFVLITGKWHLPGLSKTPAVAKILASNKVIDWFSQNQIYPDIPVKSFPYGVPVERAHTISLTMSNSLHSIERKELYVPAVTVHPHLQGRVREMRIALQEFMSGYVDPDEYYKKISQHRYVISPPGDRPDTYRHWEAVALGAIPISEVPISFGNLFGTCMLNTTDLLLFVGGNIPSNACKSNPAIATFEYWHEKIVCSRQTFLRNL